MNPYIRKTITQNSGNFLNYSNFTKTIFD